MSSTRQKVLLAVVMFVMVFVAVPVFAGSGYIALRGGAFSPNSDEEGLKDFDTGYNIEVAYGYKINPNFAVEGGIGRYSSEYEETVTIYGVDYSATATASAIPITVTAKGIIPLPGDKVEFYGGVGIGLYLATSEAEIAGVSMSYDANAFGFHVVGGADFNISDNIAIGGEIKWVSVEPEFDIVGVKYDTPYGGLIFNAGVKYKF